MKKLTFKIEKCKVTGKFISTINDKKIVTFDHPANSVTLHHLLKTNLKGFCSLRSVDSVSEGSISVSYV